ncbi:MAG: glycosyltransferase, partial [Burkholderiales bacterium]
MTAPLVTIGLSMRNSASTIDACLRSVLAQTFSQWELRLFDDGSSDASVARARAFDDPRIVVTADGVQRGLGARMNQAIDAAQGRYFARIDADDIAYPDRLARQVAYLDAHPGVDLLGAAMMVFKDDGEPMGLHPVRTTHEELCTRPYSGFYLPHPTWMGRIEWFRRWRYDASYSKAQDQDLLRRAYRTSRFAALAEPLVGYRQDVLSIAKSWRTRYHVVRSVLALARRERAYGGGLVGALGQGARAVVDTIAIGSGAGRH